uniref:Uncharacterized protein n=1 Tax=Halimeda micronesica TaxID=170426 RepID=A0A386AXB8_9CHLO|nr:hypothetical protein [Halimeda micronesica]
MSKLKNQSINLKASFFVETRFLSYVKQGSPGAKKKSSFSLVFQALETGFLSKIKDNNLAIEQTILGDFFINQILEQRILQYHPPDTYYDRLEFRIASETKQIQQTIQYEFPILRGQGVLNENKILGNYSCRFRSDSQKGLLNLRIKNMVSNPKRDYFINFLLLNSLKFSTENAGFADDEKIIYFQLVGLTLNNTFENMYDDFDEIIEKISI